MPRNRALSSFSALFAIPPHSFFFFSQYSLTVSLSPSPFSIYLPLSLSLLFLCWHTAFNMQHRTQSIDQSSSFLPHGCARIGIHISYISFFFVLTVSLHIYTYTYNISENNIAHFFCFSIYLYCLFFLVRQISQSVAHRSTITTSSKKSYIKVRLACEAKCIIIRTIVWVKSLLFRMGNRAGRNQQYGYGDPYLNQWVHSSNYS